MNKISNTLPGLVLVLLLKIAQWSLILALMNFGLAQFGEIIKAVHLQLITCPQLLAILPMVLVLFLAI